MRNTFLFVPLVFGIISDSVIATAIAAEKGVMAVSEEGARCIKYSSYRDSRGNTDCVFSHLF